MGSGPVGRIEHLAGFKDHLDDVLVAVGLCGLDGVVVENEEVHCWCLVKKGLGVSNLCGFYYSSRMTIFFLGLGVGATTGSASAAWGAGVR